MKLLNTGFDHIEFTVARISDHTKRWEDMGFECVGERTLQQSGIRSALYQQGQVRILITEPISGNLAADRNLSVQFQRSHMDGICVLALEVTDARAVYADCIKKGARSAMEPKRFESQLGWVDRAEVWTPAGVRYAFIQRGGYRGTITAADGSPQPSGAYLFDEGLEAARFVSPSPMGLQSIDHLTNNIDMGQTATWVKFYTEIFGFQIARHFDIRTGRTGLISDVVQSPCGRVKVPINEATEKASQVQEFVDRFKGAGVQHLAFLTTDIMETVGGLKKLKYAFLNVPHTYYEVVPTRVPGVTESLEELERLGILLDGEGGGYLMQIFTAELVGPFFLEFIQRKGNNGFGEGNFRALFEAIERDQIQRGVLQA